jgi:hypothetical protein
MPKMSKAAGAADELAEMTLRGGDVFSYFTYKFAVVGRERRVNVKTLLARALSEERANRPKSKRRIGQAVERD